MDSYENYGIIIPYRRKTGNVKCVCPNCKNKRSHPNDRSLSVNLDKGVWKCHYCQWTGALKNDEPFVLEDKPRKEYKRPVPKPLTELSRKLVTWFNNRGISERVLKQMRIGEGEEYMPQINGKINTLQFNYYLHDELINVKYRDGHKNFKLTSGAELIPYNIDAIEGKEDCIIVEGEMDCLSFIEAGFENCISVPNGANGNLSYLDDFVDGFFEDKETIYIAVDMDECGTKLRDELIRRFGSERCKIVTFGEGCKDANEHLVKYGKESLESCISGAKDVKVDGVYQISDYEDELDLLYRNGLQKGFVIGHPNFDSLCSFETRRLCVVTGIPSSGKSEFIDEMCVRLNLSYGFKVGMFSPENMPFQYHASKIIEKITGKKLEERSLSMAEFKAAKEYVNENFFHVLPEDKYSLDRILEKAKYLIRKYGIKIFVIDPFNTLERDDNPNMTEREFINSVISRFSMFCRQYDLLGILMAHPRKILKKAGTENEYEFPTLYDISGSADFYNKADFGLIVHRNYTEKYTTVRVEKVKFKHLGEKGDATFKYDVENGRYIPWNVNSNDTVVYNRANFLIKQSQDSVQQTAMQFNSGYQSYNDPFRQPANDSADDNYWLNRDDEEVPF